MITTSLHELSVEEAAQLIASGELSPVTYLEACLERIGRLDGQVRAFGVAGG